MIVPKDMTIYTAAELKPLLLADVRGSDAAELDLSCVTEIDSAGVQLLFLAQREARANGRALRVTGCTPAVREILDLVGFAVREEVAA